MRIEQLLGIAAVLAMLIVAAVAEFAERRQKAERAEYERVLIGEISPAQLVESKRRGLHTRN